MPADVRLVRPTELSQPIGLYSHGSLINEPKSLLHVAGQLAVGQDGEVVGTGDFATQIRQVFSNLGHVLNAVGMEFVDVLKFTTYLVRSEHIDTFYSERAKLFSSLFPAGNYPPNTLLVVQRLVRAEFLIEVEAVAGTT